MPSDSALHEPRTNAEQSETTDDLRVSFESLSRAERGAILEQCFAEWEEMCDGQVVYFMAGGGLIKIGTSSHVRKRFIAIQNSSPVPVDLIHIRPGTRMTEGLLHQKFAHLRRHGEWFEDAPELRAQIDEENWNFSEQLGVAESDAP